jgi:hypothetical protein
MALALPLVTFLALITSSTLKASLRKKIANHCVVHILVCTDAADVLLSNAIAALAGSGQPCWREYLAITVLFGLFCAADAPVWSVVIAG